jgi:hypothetical protein
MSTATPNPSAQMRIDGFISGGLMGADPFDASSWSGSSRALFEALRAEGVLSSAYGVDISKLEFALRALPAYSSDREVWRRRVYQSASYRRALTQRARRESEKRPHADLVLQLGAYADGPSAFGPVPVLTYQDGNAAEFRKSPNTPAALKSDDRLYEGCIAFERHVAAGAARILTTSETLRRSFIEDYGVDPQKVVSVGIGVNIEPPASLPRRDFSRVELLFVGKEFRRKGGDALIAAFARVRARHKQARLHIVGPPTPPAEIAGVDGVVFHGFLSRDDAASATRFRELLSTTTLAVLPSRFEPLGLAPLEAMAWGVPAAVTGRWALAENVKAGEHGFHFPEVEAEAIAATILAAFESPARLEAMGAAGFAYVPGRFSWRRVARDIAAIARDVVAESSARQ